jgi:PPK2 family polyphosphate:nucleotide phosphotransferase
MNPPASAYTVPFDGSFRIGDHATAPGETTGKKALEKELRRLVATISERQRMLYADDRYALLLIFQAMDAAGKDGTIRAVMSGVNPAGCQVSSFKAPSNEDLEHDWLWRTSKRLPERGRIGIFNRSYYEEVLAVRVRPEYLRHQRIPATEQSDVSESFWQERFESIQAHEKHLARNGTVVLKFWLNVSPEEQKARFMKRLTTAEKYWKFSKGDLSERDRWDEYMSAYESLLNETSKPHAPWFAIPADDKRTMRVTVARIIADTLAALPLRYPEKTAEEIARFEEHIARLKNEPN